MAINQYAKEAFLKRTFMVELVGIHCHPGSGDFVFPTDEVIAASIEKYADDAGVAVKFLTKEKPIRFTLDGKPYEAALKLGRFRQGYYVFCDEILG